MVYVGRDRMSTVGHYCVPHRERLLTSCAEKSTYNRGAACPDWPSEIDLTATFRVSKIARWSSRARWIL